ncbi:MAG: ferredoxin FdxA [Planctomycetota bacterium]
MAHVVCDPCVKCKFTDCVAVCPVNCFHEGVNALVIDPDTCIDCGLCAPECPVTAIFPEADVPEKWSAYKELNKELAPLWPAIEAHKDPLPTAEAFRAVENKIGDFDPSPFAG